MKEDAVAATALEIGLSALFTELQPNLNISW